MHALSDDQLAALTAAFNNPNAVHPEADFYLLLADFIDAAFPYPDQPPNEYRAAILWLRGAAEVNADAGSQSDFIRGYNKAQYEARTGLLLSDAEMDAVSNEVAQKVYHQIFVDEEHNFPTIDDLAKNDAAPAAEMLFRGDMGGWAGNHLFLFLGYTDAFYNNIVESGSSSYDAVALIKFTDENFATWSNGWDAVVQSMAFPSGPITYWAAISDMSTFIEDAYFCVPHSDHLNGSTFVRTFSNILLGRVDLADTMTGSEDKDLIQAGGGNDTIFGSLGADVLDGAEGTDVVDYSHLNSERIFTLTDDVQSTAGYVGYVTGTGRFDVLQASLFGIEKISGGLLDDEFHIQSVSSILTSIDGGGQNSKGDLLVFDGVTTGVSLDMIESNLLIGNKELTAIGFENVIGSAHNDTITGDTNSNVIKGNEGADELRGHGGNDVIIFDADDTIVKGGDGQDVAVFMGGDDIEFDLTAQGFEVLIAGGGNDTITMSGDGYQMAAGGGGDDVFYVERGGLAPKIVWGGGGQDRIEWIETIDPESIDEYWSSSEKFHQTGILVVQVNGLTQANFAEITVNSLGLSEFDLSLIDVIVLNPDGDIAVAGADIYEGMSYVNGISDYLGGMASMQSWDFSATPIETGSKAYSSLGEIVSDGYGGSILYSYEYEEDDVIHWRVDVYGHILPASFDRSEEGGFLGWFVAGGTIDSGLLNSGSTLTATAPEASPWWQDQFLS